MSLFKTCKDCGEEKLISKFYRSSRVRDGHLNQCKSCHNAAGRHLRLSPSVRNRQMERSRRWRLENPLGMRAQNRRTAGKNIFIGKPGMPQNLVELEFRLLGLRRDIHQKRKATTT